MPIYLYQCDTCGVRFERMQRMSDEPLTSCPECEDGQVHRIIQPVGVIFRGSGFYITDNRQPSSTLTPSKEKESEQVADKAVEKADKKAEAASTSEPEG